MHDHNTESLTEPVTEELIEHQTLAARIGFKLNRLKTELVSLLVLLLGMVEVIDPSALFLIFGNDPKARGYILVAIAIAMYVLRRLTSAPPEPMVRRKGTGAP